NHTGHASFKRYEKRYEQLNVMKDFQAGIFSDGTQPYAGRVCSPRSPSSSNQTSLTSPRHRIRCQRLPETPCSCLSSLCWQARCLGTAKGSFHTNLAQSETIEVRVAHLNS